MGWDVYVARFEDKYDDGRFIKHAPVIKFKSIPRRKISGSHKGVKCPEL
jgi:hypothetical protein